MVFSVVFGSFVLCEFNWINYVFFYFCKYFVEEVMIYFFFGIVFVVFVCFYVLEYFGWNVKVEIISMVEYVVLVRVGVFNVSI